MYDLHQNELNLVKVYDLQLNVLTIVKVYDLQLNVLTIVKVYDWSRRAMRCFNQKVLWFSIYHS